MQDIQGLEFKQPYPKRQKVSPRYTFSPQKDRSVELLQLNQVIQKQDEQI